MDDEYIAINVPAKGVVDIRSVGHLTPRQTPGSGEYLNWDTSANRRNSQRSPWPVSTTTACYRADCWH